VDAAVMKEQAFRVSFPLKLHDGTEHDVEGEAVMVWREWADEEGVLAGLDQVTLTSAEVDGVALNDEQLRRFQDLYRPLYIEALEWMALSMMQGSGAAR
jgi:hypothetical protein